MNQVKRLVHFTLTIMTLGYILTGFGITQYRIVETLTLGLLTKNLSFRIHTDLTAPFIISLLMHLYITRSSA